MKSGDRTDWWIAAGVALVLHVGLIVFLLQGMRSKRATEAAAAPAQADGSYRDIPAAPEGIPVDTLPFAGLRPEAGEGTPIVVLCEYELRGDVLVLSSGPVPAAGVLGCGAHLPAIEPLKDTHLRAHYNVRGDLLGILGHDEPSLFFETVRSWQLAQPRPGRQWQGSVIFDLSIR